MKNSCPTTPLDRCNALAWTCFGNSCWQHMAQHRGSAFITTGAHGSAWYFGVKMALLHSRRSTKYISRQYQKTKGPIFCTLLTAHPSLLALECGICHSFWDCMDPGPLGILFTIESFGGLPCPRMLHNNPIGHCAMCVGVRPPKPVWSLVQF